MAKLNLTPEQIEMLRKGYRRAQELPEGFDMSEWAKESDKAPCGTVCCYAAELLFANGVYTPQELSAEAVKTGVYQLIGVPYKLDGNYPFGGLDPLFFVVDWPKELRKKYESTNIPSVRAEALAEVVERFIAADGDTSGW